MFGLGDFPGKVEKTLKDLVEAGCNMLTIGQYLQPSKKHIEVDRFVSSEEFDNWRKTALETGFSKVGSCPFVRSSYLMQRSCIRMQPARRKLITNTNRPHQYAKPITNLQMSVPIVPLRSCRT